MHWLLTVLDGRRPGLVHNLKDSMSATTPQAKSIFCSTCDAHLLHVKQDRLPHSPKIRRSMATPLQQPASHFLHCSNFSCGCTLLIYIHRVDPAARIRLARFISSLRSTRQSQALVSVRGSIRWKSISMVFIVEHYLRKSKFLV